MLKGSRSTSMRPASIFEKIQDVVDDAQKGLRALAHHGDASRLRRLQPRAFKHLHHPEHSIHRRADLMAHRGEEGGLRPVGRLGLRPRGFRQVPLAFCGFAGGLKLLEEAARSRSRSSLGSAKVDTSSICRFVNGSTFARPSPITPIGHALAQQWHAQH